MRREKMTSITSFKSIKQNHKEGRDQHRSSFAKAKGGPGRLSRQDHQKHGNHEESAEKGMGRGI